MACVGGEGEECDPKQEVEDSRSTHTTPSSPESSYAPGLHRIPGQPMEQTARWVGSEPPPGTHHSIPEPFLDWKSFLPLWPLLGFWIRTSGSLPRFHWAWGGTVLIFGSPESISSSPGYAVPSFPVHKVLAGRSTGPVLTNQHNLNPPATAFDSRMGIWPKPVQSAWLTGCAWELLLG